MLELKNYINGTWEAPCSEEYLESLEPATGNPLARVPSSDADDVSLAVAAAQKAFPNWSSLTRQERMMFLWKIAEKIEQQQEALALLESQDTGKPLSLARRMDIPRAVSNLRFFATAIAHEENPCYPTDGKALNYVLYQPLGVVGCISPWNLPLYLFTWKIAPALAAGCTVVAKPSELSPITAYKMAELCHEVGLPQGVLNIVHGLGSKAGNAIVVHPTVKAISFTGGTQTGKVIATAAAPMFKKLSLELGGKNPMIIFADCRLENAVETAITAAFTNQGQICLCASRIFVEKSIYEVFKEQFLSKARALVVGDPLDEKTQLGAVISAAHQQKILSYIALAEKEGGKILCGGSAFHPVGRCANGFFVLPTVIEGLSTTCRTNQEEIFGPVVTIQPFEKEEDVIAWANNTPYGLAASIWTENLTRAHKVATALQSGIVWVNTWLLRDLRTPFGGVKQSGIGREGGWEALRFFTETKNICLGF